MLKVTFSVQMHVKIVNIICKELCLMTSNLEMDVRLCISTCNWQWVLCVVWRSFSLTRIGIKRSLSESSRRLWIQCKLQVIIIHIVKFWKEILTRSKPNSESKSRDYLLLTISQPAGKQIFCHYVDSYDDMTWQNFNPRSMASEILKMKDVLW